MSDLSNRSQVDLLTLRENNLQQKGSTKILSYITFYLTIFIHSQMVPSIAM